MDSIFSNTKEAFTLKTNFELKRAKFLFKIIQNKFLVNIGTSLTNFSLKFHLPVTSIIKLTVFNHFCGGVSEIDCNPAIKKMFNKRVRVPTPRRLPHSPDVRSPGPAGPKGKNRTFFFIFFIF